MRLQVPYTQVAAPTRAAQADTKKNRLDAIIRV